MVGVARLELTTSCSQSKRATKLRYTPLHNISLFILQYFDGIVNKFFNDFFKKYFKILQYTHRLQPKSHTHNLNVPKPDHCIDKQNRFCYSKRMIDAFKDVEFIYFDLGYTLVDETEAWKQRFAEQCQSDAAKRLCVTEAALRAEMEQASFRREKSPYKAAVAKLTSDIPKPYNPQYERCFPFAKDLLSSLCKKYRLGVLANQSDGVRDRLKRFGILQFFTTIVSSFDYDLHKPDIRLFKIAAKQANVVPQSILMVGDRLDNDVVPAKQMGFKTLWVRQGFGAFQRPSNDTDTPDATVDSLQEILSLL